MVKAVSASARPTQGRPLRAYGSRAKSRQVALAPSAAAIRAAGDGEAVAADVWWRQSACSFRIDGHGAVGRVASSL